MAERRYTVMFYTTFDSPIGELLLTGDGRGLQRLSMQTAPRPVAIDPRWQRDERSFTEVREQLEQYFDGARREFEVELDLIGNPFELRVWDALLEIPYGETAATARSRPSWASRRPHARSAWPTDATRWR